MAHSICQIGAALPPEDTVKFVVPTVIQVFKDEATEVRLSLLENVVVLVEALKKEDVEIHLVPSFKELAKDKQWRVRMGIMHFVPKVAHAYPELFNEHLQGMALEWLSDNVFQIREEAAQTLIKINKKEWFLEVVMEKVNEFAKSDRCTLRMQALMLIKAVKDHLPPHYLNGDIFKIIAHLRNDSVPNVRFNVCKLFDAMLSLFDEANRKQAKSILENMRDTDLDNDVKYFAAKALRNEF